MFSNQLALWRPEAQNADIPLSFFSLSLLGSEGLVSHTGFWSSGEWG